MTRPHVTEHGVDSSGKKSTLLIVENAKPENSEADGHNNEENSGVELHITVNLAHARGMASQHAVSVHLAVFPPHFFLQFGRSYRRKTCLWHVPLSQHAASNYVY